MSERKPIGKTTRFEVFKRDRFTCQYCGSKAPDVILHVDHIKPVAEGGQNDVLNLVTACVACNAGKGARLLDDAGAVSRQRNQLEALEARREQLEMMVQWRDSLESVAASTVDLIADQIEQRGGFRPNENGKGHIRRWLKKYSFDEILAAVDHAFDIYMRWRGDEPSKDAWEIAFKKVPGVCSVRRQSADKPYLQQLFYVQGILRNRFRDKRGQYITALEGMIIEWGADAQFLEDIAKTSAHWADFNEKVWAACDAARQEEDANG